METETRGSCIFLVNAGLIIISVNCNNCKNLPLDSWLFVAYHKEIQSVRVQEGTTRDPWNRREIPRDLRSSGSLEKP